MSMGNMRTLNFSEKNYAQTPKDRSCGISLQGMRFWARPAWEVFRFGAWVSGRARSEVHFASGHGFLGMPGMGGISLRGMRFWACPAWEVFRFGGCISGRARRGRHFASGHGFLGMPGMGGISLRGMRFWACPA